MKKFTCEACGRTHTSEYSLTCPGCDRLRESADLDHREIASPIRPYPPSKSPHARYAEWEIQTADEILSGVAWLSATHPRRALYRLIAHLRKEVPGALAYAANFPAEDIYCGEGP